MGIGLGWIPHDPATVHAPGWVLVVSGFVFFFGGLTLLSFVWFPQVPLQNVTGLVILVGLALISHWVAFGEGDRKFTRTTSINGSRIESGPVDEGIGRFAFGAGAVMLDLALAALAIRRVRKWWRER